MFSPLIRQLKMQRPTSRRGLVWLRQPRMRERPPFQQLVNHLRGAEFAPSRGRGLKLAPCLYSPHHGVRPLTGARIETDIDAEHSRRLSQFAPSRGRGLKQLASSLPIGPSVRPLTGARIETVSGTSVSCSHARSPPHGGAD